MSWITENPWPLVLILAGAAVILLLVGQSRSRAFAMACALVAAAVYLVESWVVTPAEEVEQGLQSMLQGFIESDINSIERLISDDSPGLIQEARKGLEMVELHPAFHLQDVAVSVSDDGQSADAHLRANGTLTIRNSNVSNHAATRWRTRWVRQEDTWKLSEVHRLNVVTGDEIGIHAVE
jgi:hypothetical protein